MLMVELFLLLLLLALAPWVLAWVELLAVLVEMVLVWVLEEDEGKVCLHTRNADEGPIVNSFHPPSRNLRSCFHDK